MRPSLLVSIFVVWAVTCVGVGAAYVRRAPAVSFAMFGSVLGAVAGFLVGNADGPAQVPAYTAVGASVGLFANGAIGLTARAARPCSQALRRAALLVLIAGPLAAGGLAVLVQVACPLYVTGKGTGFCNYQEVDQLGGWASRVIVAFLVDAWFVGGLLLVSARQAQRSEEANSDRTGDAEHPSCDTNPSSFARWGAC